MFGCQRISILRKSALVIFLVSAASLSVEAESVVDGVEEDVVVEL